MANPPVSLTHYVIMKSLFEIDNSDEEKQLKSLLVGKMALLHPEALSFSLQIGRDKTKGNAFRCTLSVKSVEGPSDLGCKFEFAFLGYYMVPDITLKHEKASEIITTHFPSLLYGSIRDHLMTLTSRGPYQMLVLPTIQFRPLQLDLDNMQFTRKDVPDGYVIQSTKPENKTGGKEKKKAKKPKTSSPLSVK